ncbi:MAG: hypothetical protein CL908_11925 [Deltaproteobacteria bacterium]|nr:hypothetical protein [Deltaproteobacteria bacterium]
MADESLPALRLEMPVPETDELGRYLEDTVTIDWQTPRVMEWARALVEGVTDPAGRVTRLFEFVRDEIEHSLDVPTEKQTCRASEVLRERTGLWYAKSHLLAGLRGRNRCRGHRVAEARRRCCNIGLSSCASEGFRSAAPA